MSRTDLEIVASLPFFTKENLRLVEKSKPALDFNLKYWRKKGEIIALKRGTYVLASRWEKEANKDGLREYWANKLLEPSYLSLEYVLQKHSLITEAAYAITSITNKTPRRFTGPLGTFLYFSLAPRLFTGFTTQKFGTGRVFIATKAKALFDLLYLRSKKVGEKIFNEWWLEQQRFNWENFSARDLAEFKRYIILAGSTKMRLLGGVIAKKYA